MIVSLKNEINLFLTVDMSLGRKEGRKEGLSNNTSASVKCVQYTEEGHLRHHLQQSAMFWAIE